MSGHTGATDLRTLNVREILEHAGRNLRGVLCINVADDADHDATARDGARMALVQIARGNGIQRSLGSQSRARVRMRPVRRRVCQVNGIRMHVVAERSQVGERDCALGLQRRLGERGILHDIRQ